jgi:hypothetical protein
VEFWIFSHNFINFVSTLKNSSKDRKLWSWKNFNSKFMAHFKMILVKTVASNLDLPTKTSTWTLKVHKSTFSIFENVREGWEVKILIARVTLQPRVGKVTFFQKKNWPPLLMTVRVFFFCKNVPSCYLYVHATFFVGRKSCLLDPNHDMSCKIES